MAGQYTGPDDRTRYQRFHLFDLGRHSALGQGMPTLVMIPALCCDEGLYDGTTAALSDLVSPRIIIPYAATLAACADKVLRDVEGDFIIMGTSFGGHVAREVALAASARVKGLWIMGAGAGAVASPQAALQRSAKLRDGRA